MRRKSKTDANQTEIVKTFRKLGFSVAITSMVGKGFPDIVIGKHGFSWLIEIKDGNKSPSKRALTTDEEKFQNNWKGGLFIIETIDQAITLANNLDQKGYYGA